MIEMTVVRLRLVGDGPDFQAVVKAMASALAALTEVQGQVLRSRKSNLTWSLASIKAGSVVADLTPVGHGVDDAIVETVIDTFTRGCREAAVNPRSDSPGFLSENAWEKILDLGRMASRGGLSGFTAVRLEANGQEPKVAPPVLAISDEPDEVDVDDAIITVSYIGVLRGTVNNLTRGVQTRHVTLRDEITRRDVTLYYPPEMHDEIVQTLLEEHRGPRRVQVHGLIQADADGRPKSMRVRDIEILPRDDDLPSLTAIVGSMPNLTQGQSSTDWTRRARNEIGPHDDAPESEPD
jgi:hypothetical protein